MRFLYSLAFAVGVHAGDAGDSAATASVSTPAVTTAAVAVSANLTERSFNMPISSVYAPVYSPASYAPAYPTYAGSCSYYTDCYSCLSNPSCLWDPNTLTYGTCKPATQCDFTYQARSLAVEAAFAAAPPATACVRTVSQCNRPIFPGAPLDPNPQRGIGCTNHGQCGANQYCFSCAKCVGNCAGCRTGGVPVSGMCGPASRCPIDRDSISGACPTGGSIYPTNPIYPTYPGSCSYYSCSSCTAAYGCIWSGSVCYYSTTPCSGYGCANTPTQCYSNPVYPPVPTYPTYPGSCNYYSCSSCAAAYGCIWSGSSCYYSTTPCTGYGCANTPEQCYGGGSIYPTYPTTPGSCNAYYSCSSCAAAYGCIWSGSSCYYSTTPCTGYGCANTPDQCYGGVTPYFPTYPTYPANPIYPSNPTSCSYYSCSSCTAAYGCIWSGSVCYYSTTPCSGIGCANTPSQCSSSWAPYWQN